MPCTFGVGAGFREEGEAGEKLERRGKGLDCVGSCEGRTEVSPAFDWKPLSSLLCGHHLPSAHVQQRAWRRLLMVVCGQTQVYMDPVQVAAASSGHLGLPLNLPLGSCRSHPAFL